MLLHCIFLTTKTLQQQQRFPVDVFDGLRNTPLQNTKDPQIPGRSWWLMCLQIKTVPYIDVVFLIAQKEVVHDGSFMQLRQCGHVLHSMDAAGVHRVHRLPVQLCLL